MDDYHPDLGAPVTKSWLVRDLTGFGLGRGGVVMVHTRMSALGWVVGGAETVVEALLETIGPEGTLLVVTSWADAPPYEQDDWDDVARRAYELECPPFDPRKAHAEWDVGRVPEAVRTWPGAEHSRHPSGAFTAVGPRADWLLRDQSLDEGYGASSPLERLVEAEGSVLLLGAPLETVTLLHLAEYRADVGEKIWIEYDMPLLIDGERTWRRIRELNSSSGAFPYDDLGLDEDAFAAISKDALATGGVGRSGRVANADAHLFPSGALLEHATRWLEERFRR